MISIEERKHTAKQMISLLEHIGLMGLYSEDEIRMILIKLEHLVLYQARDKEDYFNFFREITKKISMFDKENQKKYFIELLLKNNIYNRLLEENIEIRKDIRYLDPLQALLIYNRNNEIKYKNEQDYNKYNRKPIDNTNIHIINKRLNKNIPEYFVNDNYNDVMNRIHHPYNPSQNYKEDFNTQQNNYFNSQPNDSNQNFNYGRTNFSNPNINPNIPPNPSFYQQEIKTPPPPRKVGRPRNSSKNIFYEQREIRDNYGNNINIERGYNNERRVILERNIGMAPKSEMGRPHIQEQRNINTERNIGMTPKSEIMRPNIPEQRNYNSPPEFNDNFNRNFRKPDFYHNPVEINKNISNVTNISSNRNTTNRNINSKKDKIYNQNNINDIYRENTFLDRNKVEPKKEHNINRSPVKNIYKIENNIFKSMEFQNNKNIYNNKEINNKPIDGGFIKLEDNFIKEKNKISVNKSVSLNENIHVKEKIKEKRNIIENVEKIPKIINPYEESSKVIIKDGNITTIGRDKEERIIEMGIKKELGEVIKLLKDKNISKIRFVIEKILRMEIEVILSEKEQNDVRSKLEEMRDFLVDNQSLFIYHSDVMVNNKYKKFLHFRRFVNGILRIIERSNIYIINIIHLNEVFLIINELKEDIIKDLKRFGHKIENFTFDYNVWIEKGVSEAKRRMYNRL